MTIQRAITSLVVSILLLHAAPAGAQPAPIGGDTVRVAYIVPSNRTPQPGAVPNLQELILLARDWYCEQMDRHGAGALSFRYETEPGSSLPRVHVVNVSETDDYLRGDIWSRVGQAASAAGVPTWTPGEVWLLVPEIHLQQADASIVGGVALGASFGSGSDPGVAMIGSTLLSIPPAAGLHDTTPYAGQIIPGIGPLPLVPNVSFAWYSGSTVSSLMSGFTGATVHELSHAIGIGHDFRNDDNFHGNLMGNGLRGMRGALFPATFTDDECRLSRAAALVLRSSRYFTPCSIVLPEPPAGGIAATSSTNDARSGVQAGIPGALLTDEVAPPSWATTGGVAGSWPFLSIVTSGAQTPLDGLVRIEFHATVETELSSAVLRHNGETVDELALSGGYVVETFTTAWFDPGTENDYQVSVYDTSGNRANASTTITPAVGANRAPRPFFRVSPSVVRVGDSVLLDASGTSDPDGSNAAVAVEWDLDDDGIFDTAPTTDKTHTVAFTEAGPRRVRVRVTDPDGAQARSTAIALRVVLCPADVDGSGSVSVDDLVQIIQRWGPCPPDPLPCPGDTDGDGDVDVDDLVAVIQSWGDCG